MDEHSQSTSQTNSSLMANLHDGSAAAWDEFVAKYTRLIHGHCRKYRLQEADTDDLTQEVLIRLLTGFQTFEYDREKGKFRGWLRKTTGFVIKDFWRKRGRSPFPVGGDSGNGLADTPSDEHFVDELVETMLYAQAESSVLADVPAWHREAYFLSQQGKTPEEVAPLLQQEVGTVSVALWRIARRIEGVMKELSGA